MLMGNSVENNIWLQGMEFVHLSVRFSCDGIIINFMVISNSLITHSFPHRPFPLFRTPSRFTPTVAYFAASDFSM
jgi:hypothetical protein